MRVLIGITILMLSVFSIQGVPVIAQTNNIQAEQVGNEQRVNNDRGTVNNNNRTDYQRTATEEDDDTDWGWIGLLGLLGLLGRRRRDDKR